MSENKKKYICKKCKGDFYVNEDDKWERASCPHCQEINELKETDTLMKSCLLYFILPIALLFGYFYYDTRAPSNNPVGEYYWQYGYDGEATVFINEDGSWKREVKEGGALQKDELGWYSGRYVVLDKEFRLRSQTYNIKIISFDGKNKYGYLLENGCIKQLPQGFSEQQNIYPADIPFRINDIDVTYCKN